MSKYSSEIEQLTKKLEHVLAQMPKEREPVTFRSISKGYAFNFIEEYAQWKYEHPVLSRILAILRFVVISALILFFMWWLAGTSAGRAVGLESVKNRITFGYYSAVWASKGVPPVDSLPVTPRRFSGTIEKVVGDVLIVSYYRDGKSVRRLARPANVVITDKGGFKEWAEQYILKGVTIDFYIPIDKASGHDVWGVVIWSKRVPINVQLVERGYGTPEINPETQVVNSVFSQYYLQRAKSG